MPNPLERAREWLRKTYDLETHTGRAYTISSEHGRLDVEKVLAAYASECVSRERLRCAEIARKHTFERTATEFERGVRMACDRIAAAIEKEGD